MAVSFYEAVWEPTPPISLGCFHLREQQRILFYGYLNLKSRDTTLFWWRGGFLFEGGRLKHCPTEEAVKGAG